MPVVLNTELQPIFFEQNLAPVAALDMLSGAAYRVLRAALKLGLFDELERSGTADSATLSRRLETDERGTNLLLRALEAYGYVRLTDDGHNNNSYANTPTTSQWLLADSPSDYATVLEFWHILVHRLWGNLEDSLRTGTPGLNYFEWLEENPDALNCFQRMLANNARQVAPQIAELLPENEPPRRLLDIGGSHAIYSQVLCEKFGDLQATIFDLPNALETGRVNLASAPENIAKRVDFLPGDLLKDSWGDGYDLALLFSIVHLYQPPEIKALLAKVAATLQPGGRLLVVEHVADSQPERPVTSLDDIFSRTFSLNLYHLMGGQLYFRAEMEDWLREAGFEIETDVVLEASNELLLIARKRDS
jgi:SAM-dependent methyltransferase